MNYAEWEAKFDKDLELQHAEGTKRLGCCYRHSPTGLFELFRVELGALERKIHLSVYFTYVGPCRKCRAYKRNGGILGTGLNLCLYARKLDGADD